MDRAGRIDAQNYLRKIQELKQAVWMIKGERKSTLLRDGTAVAYGNASSSLGLAREQHMTYVLC